MDLFGVSGQMLIREVLRMKSYQDCVERVLLFLENLKDMKDNKTISRTF